MPPLPQLILASSSSTRRQMLKNLRLNFISISPHIDESSKAGETASQLASRLAKEKAEAIAHNQPGSLVIGSDQVATLDGQQLHKPGNIENAVAQLSAAAGRSMHFVSAVALARSGQPTEVRSSEYRVKLRPLTADQINAYVRMEDVSHCAGSFRSEGLGAALFEEHEGSDPRTLMGMPLIALCDLLLAANYPLFTKQGC